MTAAEREQRRRQIDHELEEVMARALALALEHEALGVGGMCAFHELRYRAWDWYGMHVRQHPEYTPRPDHACMMCPDEYKPANDGKPHGQPLYYDATDEGQGKGGV